MLFNLSVSSFLKNLSRGDLQCHVSFSYKQHDSVIGINVSILFQILFPLRVFQNIEQSFLCYMQVLVDYLFYV